MLDRIIIEDDLYIREACLWCHIDIVTDKGIIVKRAGCDIINEFLFEKAHRPTAQVSIL